MKKQSMSVDVSNVKTRNTWNGIKPYSRIQTPKTVYRRQGKGRTPKGER